MLIEWIPCKYNQNLFFFCANNNTLKQLDAIPLRTGENSGKTGMETKEWGVVCPCVKT